MTYEAFKVLVERDILKYLPEQYQNYKVKIETVRKINGVKTGIFISDPGQTGKLKTAQIFYLEEAYEKIKNGKDYDSVLKELGASIAFGIKQKATDTLGIEPENLMEEMKPERIMPRLIPQRNNRQLLHNSPHLLMDDLAVVYYYNFDNVSILITESIAKEKGINCQEINEWAKRNIEKVASIKSLHELLTESGQLSENDEALKHPEFFIPMFVLSNQEKLYGAGAVINEKIMEEAGRLFKEDYYIIPSSQHEILLMGMQFMSAAEVEKMVREANRMVVRPEEFLSDHVYRYNRETKKLERVPVPKRTVKPPKTEQNKKRNR